MQSKAINRRGMTGADREGQAMATTKAERLIAFKIRRDHLIEHRYLPDAGYWQFLDRSRTWQRDPRNNQIRKRVIKTLRTHGVDPDKLTVQRIVELLESSLQTTTGALGDEI